MSDRKDLTGWRFGSQVVLRELGDGMVEIQCDCGVVKETPKQYLVNGQSKSCGCGRYATRPGTVPIKAGDKFERLTVLQWLGSHRGRRWVLAKCDCGGWKVVAEDGLRQGNEKSCGCLRKERAASLTKTHGQTRTPLYRAWESMKRRVKDHRRYPSYGPRGVTVYEPWRKSFKEFMEYMEAHVGPRPSPEHTLDRIENNASYEPGNIKWSTPAEQVRNRSSNVFLTVDGVTMCVKDWADKAGISPTTIFARLKKKQSHGEAVRPAWTPKKEAS